MGEPAPLATTLNLDPFSQNESGQIGRSVSAARELASTLSAGPRWKEKCVFFAEVFVRKFFLKARLFLELARVVHCTLQQRGPCEAFPGGNSACCAHVALHYWGEENSAVAAARHGLTASRSMACPSQGFQLHRISLLQFSLEHAPSGLQVQIRGANAGQNIVV